MADQQAFEPREHTPEFSELECRRLLATRARGRVGLTIGALPVILPVAYEYEDGVITFGIHHDATLQNAAHGHVLAFEVDAYDAESGCGWSVHVLGRATVTSVEEVPGHSVRLRCEIVNGRFLARSS